MSLLPSSALGNRAQSQGLLPLQTFYELRHKVLEDMEIHCRAEPEANSQMPGF